MQLVQLSREHHSGLRIDPARAQASAATVHLVPIVLSELRRAASRYPVFFAKDAETGQFFLAALLGLEPHENLHWDGDGQEGYVPLNILRQPFYLGDDGSGGGVLCIDMDSDAITSEGGVAITENDGSDSAYLTMIQNVMSELAGQQSLTRDFIDRAVARKLVMDVNLNVTFDNGSATELSGIYGVDERAFARQIAEISGFDDVINYAAMLVSLEQVRELVRLKNKRLAGEAAWLGDAA